MLVFHGPFAQKPGHFCPRCVSLSKKAYFENRRLLGAKRFRQKIYFAERRVKKRVQISSNWAPTCVSWLSMRALVACFIFCVVGVGFQETPARNYRVMPLSEWPDCLMGWSFLFSSCKFREDPSPPHVVLLLIWQIWIGGPHAGDWLWFFVHAAVYSAIECLKSYHVPCCESRELLKSSTDCQRAIFYVWKFVWLVNICVCDFIFS